jgi:hypothetical protein
LILGDKLQHIVFGGFVELSTVRQLMKELVEASKEFKLAGPEGFEDLIATGSETEYRYFKQVEMTEHELGNFGLILYVYSQELDEAVIYSTKFNKILNKSALRYEKQNVKLGVVGKKFFMGLVLQADQTDLLRMLSALSGLNLGVSLFEEHISKKLKLDLEPKH